MVVARLIRIAHQDFNVAPINAIQVTGQTGDVLFLQIVLPTFNVVTGNAFPAVGPMEAAPLIQIAQLDIAVTRVLALLATNHQTKFKKAFGINVRAFF